MTVIQNNTLSTGYLKGQFRNMFFLNNFEYTDTSSKSILVESGDMTDIKKSVFNTSSKSLAKFLEEEKIHGDLF